MRQTRLEMDRSVRSHALHPLLLSPHHPWTSAPLRILPRTRRYVLRSSYDAILVLTSFPFHRNFPQSVPPPSHD
jgi:hypothetical protein